MRNLKSLVIATFALGVLLRLPTFGRAMLSDDEAIYATTADALGRGALLYRDVVDHKPPLIYHLYQAAFALCGAYNTQAVHALVILSVLVTAGLLFALLRRQEPTASVGPLSPSLAAAALFLVFSTTWHDYDALAANCELFLLAPQTAAAWLLLRDLEPPVARGQGARRVATHLGVGLLVGVSVLLKYQGLTFLGASIGMLIWRRFLGRLSGRSVVALAAAEILGALAVPALYYLRCVAAGNAAAAVTWFKFNFSYVGAGLTGLEAVARGLRRTALVGGAALIPYALGLAAAVATVRRVAGAVRSRRVGGPAALEGIELPAPSAVLGVLWLATSTIAVAAGGRFFGHYFHLVLAPLCLLAAPVFRRLWQRGWSWRAPLVILSALPALFFFALATFGRPLARAIDEREPPYDEVGTRIAQRASPDERIFVWGNSPQLYVAARRPMGARFSSSNFVTGESPGTSTETGTRNADLNQSAERWEMLFDDLDARQPALFVDAAAAGWDGYGKYPLARYPRLVRYVARNYRAIEISAGVVLYRRRP